MWTAPFVPRGAAGDSVWLGQRRRDLGSLIFIDMRDREGIVRYFSIRIVRTR